MRTEGEGAGLSDDASHLAARVAIEVLGHDRLAITVRSQIPVARGLGSSAALAAAAAAAAGADDPFAVAAAYDGHPENAAASVFGGLVAATTVDGRPVHAAAAARRRRWPSSSSSPIATWPPPRPAACCPSTLSREDAVFNLGRMGLLLAGLADPAMLVPDGHRGPDPPACRAPRSSPRRPRCCGALVDAGALAACWSGAGPDADRHRARDGAGARAGGRRGALAAAGSAGPGAGAAAGPARHRLRRRGEVAARGHESRPSALPSVVTAPRSRRDRPPLRSNVLRTWL